MGLVEDVTWNEKYWDMMQNLFWTPNFIGLASIPKREWTRSGDRISIPASRVPSGNSIYTRKEKASELQSYLSDKEEILNHLFNLTFGIAGDEIISRLLFAPVFSPKYINVQGPFSSIGRNIRKRYSWDRDNVTMPDGFFTSPDSVLAVELKLGAKSSTDQLAKYVALMVWEEALWRKCNKKSPSRYGLLFVIPESARRVHWMSIGLEDSRIEKTFLEKLKGEKLQDAVRKILFRDIGKTQSILDRFELNLISWTQLRESIKKIEDELDPKLRGDQTLLRLLVGFRRQIEIHEKTGIEASLVQ